MDSLWFSELVYSPAVDPMVGMAYALARTERLKVGTSVAVLPGRHPVLVAKQLASLAAVAPKRVLPVFGLRSAIPAEREVFTVPDGERAAVFDESLRILRAALVDDSASYSGRYFTVTAAAVAPRPNPPLDIWLGGSAPAAFRRIGTLADGWLGSFLTPDEARAGREAIERAAAEAGPADRTRSLRYLAGGRRRRVAGGVGRRGPSPSAGRRSGRAGCRRLGSAAPPARRVPGCRLDEIRYPAGKYGAGRRVHRPVRRRIGRPGELIRASRPSCRMSGVALSVMSLNSGCFLMKAATIGQTGTTRLPSARVASQSLVDQNGGQAASAEPLLDFGVVENPLVVAVGDGCKPDGLAVDGDGVLPLGGADGGFGAGLIGRHSCLFSRWPQDLHSDPHERLGNPVLGGKRRVGNSAPQQGAAAEHPVQRPAGRLEVDVQRRRSFVVARARWR